MTCKIIVNVVEMVHDKVVNFIVFGERKTLNSLFFFHHSEETE